MSAGDVDMRAMIDNIRKLGKLPEEAAKEAAPIVTNVAQKLAAEGVSPADDRWAPQVKGGGRALANAAKAIKGAAIGAIIRLTLEFPYSLHNIGEGHAVKRQILPDAGGSSLPAKFAKAVLDGCYKAFVKLTGGTY
jgi:hypothetical protein